MALHPCRCARGHTNRNPIHRGFERTPLAAALVLAALCQAGHAQQHQPALAAPAHTVPEAIVLPIRFDGTLSRPTGWVLSYRNGLLGAEAPDREVGSRRVAVQGPKGGQADGVVSWEIVRTRNDGCASSTGGPCPDIIRVLAVPDGFMAVPAELSVEEGATRRILIVPAGIG